MRFAQVGKVTVIVHKRVRERQSAGKRAELENACLENELADQCCRHQRDPDLLILATRITVLRPMS